MPHILKDSRVRENVGYHVAEVAAVVDHDGPRIIDIEECEPTLQPYKHVTDLRVQKGQAPTLWKAR